MKYIVLIYLKLFLFFLYTYLYIFIYTFFSVIQIPTSSFATNCEHENLSLRWVSKPNYFILLPELRISLSSFQQFVNPFGRVPIVHTASLISYYIFAFRPSFATPLNLVSNLQIEVVYILSGQDSAFFIKLFSFSAFVQ